MDDFYTVANAIRILFFWFSPVLFVLGIIIALYSNYRVLEERLAKNITPVKVKKVLVIETNILTFHEWLMHRRVMVGITCIIFSVCFFMVFKR